MIKNGKINISSLKVLYTLGLLFERNLSMEELIKLYELYHNERISNFVMSKYINTCRFSGINIPKVKNKYTITNFPIGEKFTDGEISLFNELKNCCEKFKLETFSEHMQEILFKVNKHAEKLLTPMEVQRNKDINVKFFEKAILLNSMIKIVLNNETSYICEPIEIKLKGNKVLFSVYSNDGFKDISPNDINVIKLLPSKGSKKHLPVNVIFELYNPLAKRYQIRPNEEVMKINSSGTITVLNKHEDKEALLRRLMRYGENCKIISPKTYVVSMKELIEDTLKNYQ